MKVIGVTGTRSVDLLTVKQPLSRKATTALSLCYGISNLKINTQVTNDCNTKNLQYILFFPPHKALLQPLYARFNLHQVNSIYFLFFSRYVPIYAV